MTIKVLALQSGVTGLGDHRVLNGALIQTTGQLQIRGGIFPSGGAALSTVSAMVCAIAPVKLVVANTVASSLGPYVLVSDASVNITFADGEASVSRIDRIIARAYDNANDGSGDTKGDIYYLKGQASGAATALPANSLLLYEVTVPAGTSAGSGGINFNTATSDKRTYTSTSGGIIPVLNSTDMTNIGASAFKGMVIYRSDLNALYGFDSSVFRPIGQISVANSSSLSNISNPAQGNVAVTRDTSGVYIFNGTSWDLMTTAADAKKGIIARARRTSSTGNITTTETGVLRLDSVPVVSGRAYKIVTNGINMDTDTSNDVGTVRFRVNTAGTATTSSTLINSFRNTIDNNSQSNVVSAIGMFIAGSTGNASFLMSLVRQAGSGNLIIFCDATNYLDMWVEDMGVAPSDTGVVI